MKLLGVILFAGTALAACGLNQACCTGNTCNSGLVCDTGTMKCVCPAGEVPSGGTCVGCPKGYYCPGSNQKVACGPGYYSEGRATYSCTPCDAGTASTDNTATSHNACKTCKKDLYSSAGANMCVACPANTRVNQAHTGCDSECCCGTFYNGASCQSCGPGTYHDGDYNFAACQPCPVGTYYPGYGAQTCTPCAIGSYRASEGGYYQSDCTNCPSGQTTRKSGATNQGQCYTPRKLRFKS